MAGSISLVNKPPIAITNKLVLYASFSLPSTPSKPAVVKFAKRRRRNSLRPKILTKPYSPPQNPTAPVEPLQTSLPEIAVPPAEQNDTSVAVVSVGNDNGLVDAPGRYLARYGLYFVGVFVFQTVLAVWMLGNSSSDREGESLNVLELGKEMALLNEDKNETQLEEKVEEIRVLARKARRNEKNKNGDLSSKSKSGIEREVGNRLLKLRKSLNSGREKFPGLYVNSLSESGSGSETKTGNESLMFEKKFRFRGYLGELGESPKGFGGSVKSGNGTEKVVDGEEIDGEKMSGLMQNGRKKYDGPKGFGGSGKSETISEIIVGGEEIYSKKKLGLSLNGQKKSEGPKGFGGSVKSKALKGKKSRKRVVENGSVGDELTKLSEVEDEGIVKARLVQSGRKKSEGKETVMVNGENEVSHTRKSRTGVIQESRHSRPIAELSEPETSRLSRMENNRVSMRENPETMEDSSKHSSEPPILSRNGSSRHNEADKKPALSKVPSEESKIGTDMWWLNLPYVFVILMRRGSDPDGPAGLYTLKLGNQDDYAVAFADRGDATNFCYLLEAFFEDLGDVTTGIIPMSGKELQTAIDSEKWKVIVVKKGQLQLYAGQPFEDVEMALQALAEEAQSA